MDVEKTMNFILAQQAQFEANFARADKRLDRLERLSAQNNRLVAKLAVHGRTLRSDIRRHEKRITAAHVRAEQAYERAEEARKSADEARRSADEARKGADEARKSADEARKRAELAGESAMKMKAETDAAIKSLARTLEQFMRRNGK
jgi:hypothetical protein